MEQTNTISSEQTLKLGFTYKELGVFLLLLFLNLKFASITIIQDRSVVIDMIVYILLIVTFNYSNWTLKSLALTAILAGIYTAINFSPYKLNVLMPLLVIQSVSGIRFKRYLSISFIITGVTLLIMYIINGEGVNMAGYTFLIDRKTRMSFGFNHPNVAAIYYYCFMINGLLLLYFSRLKKYIPLYLLLIIPLWFYIYSKTASRSFLLSIAVLYGTYFYYFLGTIINKKNLLKTTRYVFIFLIFIFTAITVYFSLQREKYLTLDFILSKRLTYYDRFLEKVNTLDFFFGSDAYGNFVIDSSYIHLLFEGGVFFFIGFCVFYILSTIQMINKKAWIPICVIISFLCYGLMESLLLYSILIGTNIFWIMLYFYYKKGKMEL
ncbi:MAG: hypothetical protein AB7D46_04040 [Flavobacteriaceae bacterium]